jgi:hypothetical protein
MYCPSIRKRRYSMGGAFDDRYRAMGIRSAAAAAAIVIVTATAAEAAEFLGRIFASIF